MKRTEDSLRDLWDNIKCTSIRILGAPEEEEKKKRQRNTAQMKKQTRNTEIQINEEEIGKVPEKEFRIMIVKIIKNLENKMEKMQESINKD